MSIWDRGDQDEPYDTYEVAHWDSDYVYDDEPSISRIALWYDEGRMCGECGTEFTEKNGEPSSCEFCRNRGSELPLTKHPEVNKEAHKAVARRRRKNKQRKGQ